MRPREIVPIALALLCAALAISVAISDHPMPLMENRRQSLSEQKGLPGAQIFDARVWCASTGDSDVRAQMLLINNSKTLRNALFLREQNKTGAMNPISTIFSTETQDLLSAPLAQERTFGAEPNAMDSPIGGGDGYRDIFTLVDPKIDYIVTTPDELLSALQNARSGDVIYVEGNANIDMSGHFNVQVPAGVTIASNRGENGAAGGRIYQNRLTTDTSPAEYWPPLFKPSGAGARFTGLRIEGPDKTTNAPDARCAIHAYYWMEVDNCEIWGWSHAGIVALYRPGDVSDMKNGGYFHHNHIHHCQMSGLGYGIVMSDGAVSLIEANYFDYCRHAIAGDGIAGEGYEARYNICGPNATSHIFDMHGKPNPSGSGTIAGDTIRIHHNTFMATEPLHAFPVCIRGVPRDGAYIDHNWFYYTQAPPVWQMNGKGNIYVTDNIIGQNKTFSPSGPIEYSTWNC